MSKAGIALGVAALGAGATLTGGYAMGWFSYDVDLIDALPDADKDKQEKIFSEGCVKSLFSGVANISDTNITSVDSSNKADNGFLGEAQDTSGCLVVNGDKESPRNGDKTDNGKGNLRFLGAVKGLKDAKEKGFVVFILGKAENTSGTKKISWKGVAYTTEKEAGVWNIKGKLDAKTSTTPVFTSTETDETKFPKAGDQLGEEIKKQEFGGGFGEKSKLDKICSDTDCLANTLMNKTSLRGYWLWEGKNDGTHDLNGGTKNTEKGGSEVFEDTNGKMKEVTDSKKGAWKNGYLSGLPKNETK